MAERRPVGLQNLSNMTALEDRQIWSGMFGGRYGQSFTPAIGSMDAGGAHGVCTIEGLVASAGSGTTIDVSAGQAVITGSSATAQGAIIASNSSAKTGIAIAAAPGAGNTRHDIVVFHYRDAFYTGSDNDANIEVVTGTASGSPVDPAIPESSLALWRIVVENGDTASSDYTYQDLRTRAYAPGGLCPCLSTNRPNPVAYGEGQLIWETDTDRLYVYDGAAWIYLASKAHEHFLQAVVTPVGNSDTTNASYTDWGGSTNITVPAWASSALVDVVIAGVWSITAAGAQINLRAAIGAATSTPELRYSTQDTTDTPREPLVVKGTISGLSTGTQPFSIEAQRVSGTGAFRVDPTSDIVGHITFKP